MLNETTDARAGGPPKLENTQCTVTYESSELFLKYDWLECWSVYCLAQGCQVFFAFFALFSFIDVAIQKLLGEYFFNYHAVRQLQILLAWCPPPYTQ